MATELQQAVAMCNDALRENAFLKELLARVKAASEIRYDTDATTPYQSPEICGCCPFDGARLVAVRRLFPEIDTALEETAE